MTEPKWTPGPWRWHRDMLVSDRNPANGGEHLGKWAEAPGRGPAAEPTKALIAAAPELYAALATMEKYIFAAGWESPLLDAARTALAKARGEIP